MAKSAAFAGLPFQLSLVCEAATDAYRSGRRV